MGDEIKYTMEEMRTYVGERIPHPTDTHIKARWLYWDDRPNGGYASYRVFRVEAEYEEELDLILQLIQEEVPSAHVPLKQWVEFEDFKREQLDEPYWVAYVEHDSAPLVLYDETTYTDKFLMKFHTVRGA